MSEPLALALAALAGATTMALELLGSRWLAPAFGTTLATWSLLIAVTLLAGSAGAWWGGCCAARASCRTVAGLLLLAAGWLALAAWLAPDFVDVLLPLPLLAGAAVAVVALVLVPVGALGAVLPLLVTLRAPLPVPSPRDHGRAVGRLVAASTAGSLLGTLLAAFVLIPDLGLRRSALVLALLLAVGAGATAGRRVAWPGASVVALSGWLLLHGEPARGGRHLVDRETPYGRLTLDATASGLTMRIDGIAQASAAPLDLDRGALLLRRQYVELLPYMHPQGRTALEVGLGGGLVARVLLAHGIAVESVEINPALVALARERLQFTGPVRVGDGRALLRRETRHFDFVVLDAFAGETPPAHLVTREAFADVRARLRPGGILCLHLIGRPQHAATRAVARTMAAVFAERLCLRSGLGNELQDLFLLASDRPLRVPPHPELAAAGWLGNETFAPDLDLAPVLTDDRNPFERLQLDVAAELRCASRP